MLPRIPEAPSLKAEWAVKRLVVEIVTSSPVTSVHQGMVMAGAQTIQAGTVLWAAGVEPSPVARSLGVPLDDVGRVPVNPDLSIPGHPEVFAIGDLAAFVDETGKLLPGLAAVAVQQGRHVARNILRICNGLPSEPFHYVDLGTMATIGRAAAVVNFNWIMLSGFLAGVIWIVVHILLLIRFRNGFAALCDCGWSESTLQRSARLPTC